ncbi:MAG TPA: hypothetical protein VK459_06280, partial [Polyangiaceae bacterium]|nr:hypothetical protein [Polyangiaceae bacterium]
MDSRQARAVLTLGVAMAAIGCAPAEPAKAPEQPPLARSFAAAFDAEAEDPMAAAPYLAAIDTAVQNPGAPDALATVIASLDALVFGATPNLDLVRDHAIAYRSRDLFTEVVGRLRTAWLAGGAPRNAPAAPFMRGLIANALHRLALFVGDEQPASVWVRRRGCVGEAAVVGPLDAMPLLGIEKQSPAFNAGSPFQGTFRGIEPFATSIKPEVVGADACFIDVNATSFLMGTRAVVVDVENPRAQRVSFALTSSSAANLEAGGAPILRRGYEAGGGFVMRLATAEVPAGRVRLVVRVAQKSDGNQIELNVWDEDGLPLAARAPREGDVTDARGTSGKAIEIKPEGRDDAALSVAAAALLALGEARVAEHMLEPIEDSDATPKTTGAPATTPAKNRDARLELLYARAIEAAEDMSDTKALDRTRAAIDKAIAARKTAWEARIAQARLTERRRGAGEGPIEALKELGVSPPAPGSSPAEPAQILSNPMLLTYVALSARRQRLADVSEAAYAELAKKTPGAPLLAAVDERLHGRVGTDAVKAACEGGTSRADLSCLEAIREQFVARGGDMKAALAEIARLRRLRTAPEALREVEISVRVAGGDLTGALQLHDRIPPAQRRLIDAVGLAASKGLVEPVQKRLASEDALSARDAPYSLAPLVRILGLEPDPAPALEAEGRKLVLADMKAAYMPGAATAVLRHLERYAIDDAGLVRYTTYDLRRVSGTTDVAQGAMSFGPMLEGRSAPRLLRRRIHKRDGRMLEPDAAANAAQWSDLSQLEQGDYVEQIVEGWGLPNDSGHLVLDTPDLLPERTSVREAEIEVRRAESIKFSVWSHPLLKKAEERTENGFKVSVWKLKDALPRRIEDGMPRMERSVGVSLGTQTWENIGRAIEENIRSYEDRDPFVTRFAQAIAADTARPAGAPAASATSKSARLALVERVVATVGKRVKIAGGAELSDVSAMYGGGSQRATARTILELGQGSRSWVIYRVLRELGVPVDIAVAETEPFSVSADFPPHVGRFQHPLLVARLGAEGGDVWIDADVEGPPLPPGRVSPELRGRSAMLAGGKIVTVMATTGETGDEVDIRLTVDEKGDAKGSFTILLHGRAAQALAEAFETVVGTNRRQMLQGVVLGWLPWADVEEVTVSSSEGSWEVALRASISIHGYGRPEGPDGKTWVLPGIEPVHIVIPRGYAGTLGATYASRGARQSALLIDTALQYHVRRRVELPAGATVTRAPEGVRIEDARL